MNYNIALIPGDGIGPEIVSQAVRVLNRVGEKFSHTFSFTETLMGGAALDATGVPLPSETLEICKKSDAVLLGAVGGFKWDTLPGHLRPEAGLLGIRKGLGLFANLRPAKINKALSANSPLKSELVENVDIIIVRELAGGMYFGEKGRGVTPEGDDYARDTEQYSRLEVDRIARVGFELAAKRSGRLCSVDKANVLESSRFWREVVLNVAKDYPSVALSHMYVDNAAMQLVRYPSQFDVMVTSNMFGDILSDEASMICGSIGMLPSASLGEGTFGLYEPIHGSAPDIAGTGKANPIATILSAAMLLRISLGLNAEAVAVEEAVERVLDDGLRTADIAAPGEKILNTEQMAQAIIDRI
ncbi:MAG: 3-isopropylmalate dehydrogenase [Eubacteriales bacterium]